VSPTKLLILEVTITEKLLTFDVLSNSGDYQSNWV